MKREKKKWGGIDRFVLKEKEANDYGDADLWDKHASDV